MVAALLFYFVAACAVDRDVCESTWGFGAGEYEVEGPFFTLEDCDAARVTLPLRYTDDRPAPGNPWVEAGESACYAREIRATIP